MRRVARWTFNLLSILSLLFSLAALAAWIRSHYAWEAVGWSVTRWTGTSLHTRVCGLNSDCGAVAVFTLDRRAVFAGAADDFELQSFIKSNPESSGPSYQRFQSLGYPYMRQVYRGRSFLGFGHFGGPLPGDSTNRIKHNDQYIVIPYWFVVIATGILPAWWLVLFRRRRRAARVGLCPQCGYDLRATPTRCPECGTIPGTGA